MIRRGLPPIGSVYPVGLRRVVAMFLLGALLGGCAQPVAPRSIDSDESAAPITPTGAADAYPTPAFDGLAAEQREIRIAVQDAILAGELDVPRRESPPLVFIIHHSGPVPRDAYGYMAERLVEAGFAVFRFDKRGTGSSSGVYGCCEAEDAIAAYQVAVAQPGIDRNRVLIVAQSIGTEILAAHFGEFSAIQRPAGVALLSNLLGPDHVVAIEAPLHIIVSDSEPALDAIGRQAAAAHAEQWPVGATVYVAEQSEHTLFDITNGPIDWSDPGWVKRYHRGAMQSLVDWLQSFDEVQKEERP